MHINPECKRFTWRQKSPFIQRRLDYLLISDTYQEEVEKADIIPSINSDHSPIFLHFNSTEKQHYGPSYWKFNASLLEDTNYLELIKESISDWFNEFAEFNNKEPTMGLYKV